MTTSVSAASMGDHPTATLINNNYMTTIASKPQISRENLSINSLLVLIWYLDEMDTMKNSGIILNP